MKKILLLLCMVLCMGCKVSAQEEYPTPDYHDPDYIKMINRDDGVVTYSLEEDGSVSPYTGMLYSHAEKFQDNAVIHGIDVSKWQAKIDWKKVREAGIQFAFIRCGYTALNNPFRMYEDEYFKRNITEANAAGIKTGVYFFSNAKNRGEAEKEAVKTLELISKYRDLITLPVVYDYEAFTKDYRAYGTPRSTVTANAILFMDTIRSAGYTPMYYGCPDVLDFLFDTSKLTDYQCWLANYTVKTNYQGNYHYWQYSETGRVDGINTPVDCDFYYSSHDDGYMETEAASIDAISGLKMDTAFVKSISVRWKLLENADGYEVYKSSSLDGIYKKIKTLGKGSTWYKDTSVKPEGRQYYYKVVPFIHKNSIKQYGRPSKILAGYTKKTYKTGLKVKTSVNIRQKAGTEYNTIITIPKGSVADISRYTYAQDGTKWYRITYRKGSKKYTGYIYGKYVKTFTSGKTKNSIMVRKGAGTNYKKYTTIPVNKKVSIWKTKKDKYGDKWYYVTFTKKSRKYTGYVRADRIKIL